MLLDGKNTTLFKKKSGSTIIAIDAPHGLSGGKEFNIPQYAAYIILAHKFKPSYLIGHSIGGKTCLYYQSFLSK
jgi:triacylglycerol esterase/lipase EstA (alpha/beta hydrolase family)